MLKQDIKRDNDIEWRENHEKPKNTWKLIGLGPTTKNESRRSTILSKLHEVTWLGILTKSLWEMALSLAQSFHLGCFKGTLSARSPKGYSFEFQALEV